MYGHLKTLFYAKILKVFMVITSRDGQIARAYLAIKNRAKIDPPYKLTF